MNAPAADALRAEWLVPIDHPCFAGHFPGQPIVPGVLLTAQVLEAAATLIDHTWTQRAVQITSAKFLAPVRPGDRCDIELRVDHAGLPRKLRFDIRRGDVLAATGVMELQRAPEPVSAPQAAEPLASSSSSSPSVDAPRASASWAQAPERSNVVALRLMAWVAVFAGRRVARLLLVPITLYYLLFSPMQARNSRRFLKRALGRDANWVDGYRHIHTFASTILDRVFFLRQGVAPFAITLDGHEALQAAAREDPGAFLVGGHLGSFEVLRAVGDDMGGLDVAMVMYPGNAQKINATLHAIAPDKPVPVIALGRMESMLAVRDWLDRGGLAGMLGDRGLEADPQAMRSVRAAFMGRELDFIDGPMRLAALLKRRVYFMAGLYRGGNRYDVVFKPVVDFRRVDPKTREAAIREGVLAYVRELEHQARSAPYNWFNFHDFWLEDPPAHQPPAPAPR